MISSLHTRLLLPWVALLPLVADANWTQFRGPDGNGTLAGATLPSSLPADGGVAWKASLPGRGLSCPVTVGDKVFVTCSSGPRQTRLHVLCFRASDGTKLWERTVLATGRTMCHEKTCVAAPSPTTDGERVFALYSSNDLVCFDLDGNLLWFRGLTHDYPNASNSLGMSSSLVVAEGVLLAQVENDTESFAAGIDVRTGVNLWKLDRPKMANWCSPVVIRSAGRPTLFGLQSGKGLLAVEPKTGGTAWNYTEGASTVASSAVRAGVIYAPSHGITALEPGSPGQPPSQLWRSSQLRPGTPSPVVLEDRIYVMNDAGVLTAGELATGKRLWQLRLKGPFSSTPVAGANRLLAVNEKGLVQLVDLAKPEGEVVSEFDLGQTVLGTPSLTEGGVYIRSDAQLWKLRKP
ncbi:MAG TPA: pyrrolo-quinoline quinone [Verrucomicrobiales bacterium]|nr:pyrrolo-quinoline quinone [Verrucomicrobiales bacterium]